MGISLAVWIIKIADTKLMSTINITQKQQINVVGGQFTIMLMQYFTARFAECPIKHEYCVTGANVVFSPAVLQVIVNFAFS